MEWNGMEMENRHEVVIPVEVVAHVDLVMVGPVFVVWINIHDYHKILMRG